MSKILLFIPCYNCEKQITRVLKSINNSKILKRFNEVLIVENRSTDKTLKTVKDFIKKNKLKKTILIQNNKNYSFGGSHKVAINYAKNKKFTHLVVLHGDDQANINDILKFNFKNISEFDCFMGSRFLKNSKTKTYSKFKSFGNMVFNSIFSLFAKKKIYDLGSGLYLLKLKILNDNKYLSFPDNLTFNYFLTLYITEKKYNLKYFPISWKEEDQVSNVKIFKQTFELSKILFFFIFNKNKIINLRKRNKKYEYRKIL